MPNYIQNKLVVKNESSEMIDKFIEFVSSEETDFDFNKITPMPEILRDTIEGSDTYTGLYYYLKKKNLLEEYPQLIDKVFTSAFDNIEKKTCSELNRLYEIGEHHFNAYKETGYVSWYKWCLENWGTKWDAMNAMVYSQNNSAIFFFQTAWDGVPMLIDKLHELFPNLKFEYMYADEDFTCNCGVGFTNENGEFEFRVIEDASDEAFQTYIECWNEDEDDFVKHNGYWTRKDEFEDEE
jgi:hypothetical protein